MLTKKINKKKTNKSVKKPNQPKQYKEKKVLMENEEVAPRRNNKQRKNRVKRQNQVVGKSDNIKFKPIEGNNAATTRDNIMVIASCFPKAVEAAFCALATRSFIFGSNIASSPVYFAYVAFMQDLTQLMGSQIPASNSRLDYLNDILGSYVPKTIPFKTKTELAYSWGNLNTVQTQLNLINIRGFNFYYYVDDGATSGNWLTQSAPSSPSSNIEAFDKLAEVYSILAQHSTGLIFDSSHKDITKKYMKDVSAFTACSPYYGGGNGINGPAYSCESEVPFLAPLLSGVAIFDQTRVARNFKLTAGDTTTSFGLPFVPGFDTKYFNTCYAPEYKFIDIDEFIYLVQKYYTSILTAYVNTVIQKSQVFSPDVILAMSPFPISPQAFRIYWRQIILSMYPASQACAQFITYSTAPNSFEPLRVGSNCYPPNTDTPYIPSLIVENLRMLQPKMASVKTKFQSDKNALIYIPVFGIYRSVEAYNAVGTFYKVDEAGDYFPYESPICTLSEPIVPGMIDGTGPSGQVLQMNGSLLEDFILQWNMRINILKSVSTVTSVVGGSSEGSLLTLTRYAYFNTQEVLIDRLPEWRKPFFKNKHIVERTKEVRRTPSQKFPTIETERVYLPDSYDLFSQRTQSITSLHPITEEVKIISRYFVLPSITLEANNEPPLQRQSRVLNIEGHVWDWSKEPGFGVPSRADQLNNFAGICAPGISASSNDELNNAVSYMNTTGKGGFVGDALTEIAKLVLPNIPF